MRNIQELSFKDDVNTFVFHAVVEDDTAADANACELEMSNCICSTL